ncbi:MAG: hypothetical protein WA160_16925 [Pseudobdellovibrio sp.]
MKNIFILLLLISGLFFTNKAQAQVWATKNQWDQSWEDKYSDWVEKSWDDEIFMRPESVVYQIATDCADASYTMRALYSYLNELPFQILNPSNDIKGKYLTNEINNFNHYPAGNERFRAFLKNIIGNAGSASLANDTYPIGLDRRYLRAGAVYVTPNDHSYQVKTVNASGVPVMYSSTVPKEARYLAILNSFPFYMPKDFVTFKDGFRAFKQPQHYLMNEIDLPGYSQFQFVISKKHDENILSFGDEVASIISVVPETLAEKINRAATNMCYFSTDRGVTVGWTLNRRTNNNNRCFTAAEYDSESTPSRDRKLKLMYEYAEQLTKDPEFKQSVAMYKAGLEYIFDGQPELGNNDLLSWCSTHPPYIYLKNFTLKNIWLAIKAGTLISDPNAPLEQRWGLEPYTASCKTY